MVQRDVLAKLIERAPLALVVIGAALLVLGAAGGWSQLALVVQEPLGRIALVAGGALLVALGCLMLWREQGRERHGAEGSAVASECGVRIVFPRDAYAVEGPRTVEVSGTYARRLPNTRLQIFNASSDRLQWWPQVSPVQFDELKKTWTGSSYVQNDTYVVVMAVGAAGRALCDYYAKVGRETGHWPSLELLPEDIVECDRIWLRQTPSVTLQ